MDSQQIQALADESKALLGIATRISEGLMPKAMPEATQDAPQEPESAPGGTEEVVEEPQAIPVEEPPTEAPIEPEESEESKKLDALAKDLEDFKEEIRTLLKKE